MTLMDQVLAAAAPCLAGKAVEELVVGISLIGCCLSDGSVGVSYVMREELPNGCSAFPFAQQAEGKPAAEIAGWVVSGKDDLQRAVGAAVLDAASQSIAGIPDDEKSGQPFGVAIGREDTVGMVGYIRPVAANIKTMAGKLVLFDHGVYLRGGAPDVYPTEQEKELLPNCSVVILSGTTTINGTIDSLLRLCQNAREIVLVGTSTPMFPEGFRDTKVTRLAGAWWKNERRREIFKLISLAVGISSLSPYMIHKNAAVAHEI